MIYRDTRLDLYTKEEADTTSRRTLVRYNPWDESSHRLDQLGERQCLVLVIDRDRPSDTISDSSLVLKNRCVSI